MSRIDDAVTRIIRVKLQVAGCSTRRPATGPHPGADVLHSPAVRELAREAVRKSLVLLKNDGGVLPLKRGGRILVVGKGADSLPMQSGGWSLTWQGDKTTTVRLSQRRHAACRDAQVARRGQRRLQRRRRRRRSSAATAAIVMVAAEKPYAEMQGRHRLSRRSLRHIAPLPGGPAGARAGERQGRAGRHAACSRAGRSPRTTSSTAPTHSLRPGCRAPKGLGLPTCCSPAANGRRGFDFTGRLSFDWPAGDCLPQQGGFQFRRGYGLSLASRRRLGRLPESAADRGLPSRKPVTPPRDAQDSHRRRRHRGLDDRGAVRQAVPGPLRYRAGRKRSDRHGRRRRSDDPGDQEIQ